MSGINWQALVGKYWGGDLGGVVCFVCKDERWCQIISELSQCLVRGGNKVCVVWCGETVEDRLSFFEDGVVWITSEAFRSGREILRVRTFVLAGLSEQVFSAVEFRGARVFVWGGFDWEEREIWKGWPNVGRIVDKFIFNTGYEFKEVVKRRGWICEDQVLIIPVGVGERAGGEGVFPEKRARSIYLRGGASKDEVRLAKRFFDEGYEVGRSYEMSEFALFFYVEGGGLGDIYEIFNCLEHGCTPIVYDRKGGIISELARDSKGCAIVNISNLSSIEEEELVHEYKYRAAKQILEQLVGEGGIDTVYQLRKKGQEWIRSEGLWNYDLWKAVLFGET